MRITVRNLGVLREEATIDLKPLTIFIGPNNSGKTWLAYALGGVLGPYGSREYTQAYVEERVPTIYEPVNQAVKQILAKGNATIDLCKLAEDYGEMYFNEVAKLARSWINEFFSTQNAHFDSLDVSLNLAENKEYFLQQILHFSRRSTIARDLLTIQKRRDDSKIYAYTVIEGEDAREEEEKIGEKIPSELVKERLFGFVSTALHRSLYTGVCVFPTERTTFAASRFSERIADREQLQNVAKLTEALNALVKELDITELPTPGVASGDVNGPVGSFLDMLRASFKVGARAREARRKNAESNYRIRQYLDLADVLEKQILAGNIEFSTPEPDPNREVLFHPLPDVPLDMPVVSSMVKVLSPLVLFLRYLAQPGELLIIDEPEMNLHPEAQAKIIEFLAMLVNAGLRILITTHSPYLVDHLTNLIRAAEYKSDDQALIVDKFFLKHKDAFISQDNLSVYLFNSGEVENILFEGGKINWGTFGDVSDRIANIHYEL